MPTTKQKKNTLIMQVHTAAVLPSETQQQLGGAVSYLLLLLFKFIIITRVLGYSGAATSFAQCIIKVRE